MHRLIRLIEAPQLKKDVPAFNIGDTIRVSVRVEEADKTRTQMFEGIVIKRQGSGVRESFTVRRISFGEGVERNFPLHSPTVQKVELVRSGKVRRAKLYYLRKLTGKATKLKEFFVSEKELDALEAKHQEAKDIRAAKEQHAIDAQQSATQASEPAATTEKVNDAEPVAETSPKSS